MILTTAFWRAAGLRALYTVLAAAVPLLPPLIGGGWPEVRQAFLALALAGLLSIATSWASIPELGDGRSRWAALIDRTVRTFGQVLAAAFGSAAFLSEIRWSTLLAQAGIAALITLIRAVLDELPEAAVPVGAEGVADIASLIPAEMPDAGPTA